jgi:hypothetical protein
MGIRFPFQKPLLRRALDSFQNILIMNQFIEKDFIISNSPKDPNNHMPNQQNSFRKFLTALKER